jgi:hypothetical protein
VRRLRPTLGWTNSYKNSTARRAFAREQPPDDVSRGCRLVGIRARHGTAGGTSLDRYVWMPPAAAKAPDASGTQAAAAHLTRCLHSAEQR